MRRAVVQVVQELAPPGGIQVMVLELHRLLAANLDVHVVSIEGTIERLNGAWSRAAALENRLHALDKQPGVDLKVLVRLTHLLREVCPVAVHTHHIGPLLYGGLAARLAGIRRLVHTEHDAWHLAEPRRRRLQRAALAVLRPRLVADAQAVAVALRRAIPEARPLVIPNGIDTSLFLPGDRRMARRALRLPDSGRLIGSAGRLEPVKGHALLIEALAALPTDVTLVLAGDGSQRPILEALAARLGVAERVHFLGHIDSIVTFYRALDVFCLPSVAEGLPLSVLEAQACGVAAVVTDVGGVRDALAPEISLAVPAGDSKQLAAALATLLERPAPADPRPFVVEHRDARRMASAYEALLID